MDNLPEDSTLGAWLTTVARRHTWRLLDRNRREGYKHEVRDESASALASGDDEDLEHWELTEWLDHGLLLLASLAGTFCPPFTWIRSSPLMPRLLPAWAWLSVAWPYSDSLPGALKAGAG